MRRAQGVRYSFDHFRSVAKAFFDILGAIELDPQLWLAEDACIAPSSTRIPLTTVALCFALTPQDFKTPHHQFEANELPYNLSAAIEDSDSARAHSATLSASLDRFVSTADREVSWVVNLAFCRLRTATSGAEHVHEPRTAIMVDLIAYLCISPDHPVHLEFLGQGITSFITKLAIILIGRLDSPPATETRKFKPGHKKGAQISISRVSLGRFLLVSTTCEPCWSLLMDLHGLRKRFLQAFFKPGQGLQDIYMADDREFGKIVIYIIDELIPKYMVYKNVVNLVDEALKKIKAA